MLNEQAALQRFQAGGPPSLPVQLLVLDPMLARGVQQALSRHGLLDPPADGFTGPVSQWAMAAFCRACGLPFDGALTPAIAAALLDDAPAFPLRPGPDLAGRVVAAMLRRGDWVSRHPDCITVVYVQGMDPDGRPNGARPDAFDDARLAIRVADGRPVLAGAWEATARAGRPSVEQPLEPAGAAHLAPGQYKAWALGRTLVGSGDEHDALVQVAPVLVRRDRGRDFREDGDPEQAGQFILDQHGGRDAPRDTVGDKGSGCLVGRSMAGHAAFIALLRGDARWRVNAGYRFMTALLDVSALG